MNMNFKSMPRMFTWIGGALLVGGLAGCAGSAAENEDAGSGSDASGARALTKVVVTPINPQSFSHRFSVQGNVETDRNTLLTAEFAGLIEEVLVREGAQVTAGQALVRINTDVLNRSMEELRNQLDLAQMVFDRQERLWEQSIGSEMEFLQAKTQLEAVERSMRTLAEQKEMAVIRSPFAGVVDRCLAKTGELAIPGAPLVRIVNLEDMYVRATVSDHYAGQISKGMAAEVIVSGVDTISTRIGRVGQFINPANRTLEITLPLPAGSKFLPNMYASVWLEDLRLDSAVVIPSAWIQQDINGEDFVFVASGSGAERTVEKRTLSVGVGSGDQMLIESGLEMGAQVISKGATRVVQGQLVNVISE